MASPTQPPVPTASPVDRIQRAYAQRAETDYIFSFWTALGWTLLSCGVYGFYVYYQLVRRSPGPNPRRLPLPRAAAAGAGGPGPAGGPGGRGRAPVESTGGGAR